MVIQALASTARCYFLQKFFMTALILKQLELGRFSDLSLPCYAQGLKKHWKELESNPGLLALHATTLATTTSYERQLPTFKLL